MVMPYLDAALRLHAHLSAEHLERGALAGPDSGVRVNYRVGRFVKSYLPFLPWHDAYYYLQAQGYWILGNWRLADATGDDRFGSAAVRSADEVLSRQGADGAWPYPNREWAGRVATAEGTWAAIGLVETYRRTEERRFLDGALAWHAYLEREIGFAAAPGGQAVNYFAESDGLAVPNNSAFVLRFLAELGAVGVEVDRARCTAMLGFLSSVQASSGELPYAVPNTGSDEERRDHFQCFQYNAFQCLDLLAYHARTGDDRALSLADGLASFIRAGLAADGHVAFDCQRRRHTVVYHAAAVAAALAAARRSLPGHEDAPAEHSYAWVLSKQRVDGGFPFSERDHGVLSDRRCYPRYLAYILVHLLAGDEVDE